MQLTAGELKKALEDIKDDTLIRFQYIEEQYANNWGTLDMPCDFANINLECHGGDYQKCGECPQRNRYITATRTFVHDNELFIDGHY